MILTRLGKLLRWPRRARWFPELPQEVYRPAIFTLLFWSCWVATFAIHAFNLFDQDQRFGLAPVTVALLALIPVWAVLPWSPRAGWRRKLAALAFLAGTFAVGYLTELNLSIVFYAIVFANGVFLFGFRRGVAYAAAILPVFFANVLVVDNASWALAATAIAVPFVVFVIGICAAVVEATARREQTQGLLAELEAANAELKQYAAKIRELSVSEERARMAREIHDSVGHHLTVINLQLQNARRFREIRPDEAWEEVEGARELALEALSEVRRSVRALKPLAVEGKTGVGALSALARNFGGTGIEVSFEVEGQGRGLSGEAELVLYRAMQEGLTNAARHSGARRVSATLYFERDGVRLAVADDGRGAGARDGGFGLSALKERVEALGGALLWGDRPEGGFVLEAKLPEVSEPGAAGPPAPSRTVRP